MVGCGGVWWGGVGWTEGWWAERFFYTEARAGDPFTVKSKINMLEHVKEGDFLYNEVQSNHG